MPPDRVHVTLAAIELKCYCFILAKVKVMFGNSIRNILCHPVRTAATGILVACIIFLIGPYFLPIDQSRIALAQNYFSRAVRAATTRLAISAEYGDVRDINPTTAPARKSFCPSDASIQYAKSAPLIWFNPNLKGGAHTWVFNGAEVIKGLAAYCGDSRLDKELLAQIRDLLDPAKGPTATGGYQDQKQLGAALMFFLAKRTPEIWNQLSPAEQALIDLNMEALMYSSTFTTKDMVASQLGMNGDTNLNRDWNPNYQNGMVGMIIVTALYWGFDEFEAKLAAYDDAAFLNKASDEQYEKPAFDLRQSGQAFRRSDTSWLEKNCERSDLSIPRHHRAEPCRPFQLYCQPDLLRHNQLRSEQRFGYRRIRKNCEELQPAPQCRTQGNDA